MTSLANSISGFHQQFRREFIWLLYSKVAHVLCVMSVLCSLLYAVHVTTSWNTTVATWNIDFANKPIDIETIKSTLRAPLDVQQGQNNFVIGDVLKYEVISLLRTEASIHYSSAIIGGLSFLTFVILPIVALWLGVRVGGRDYEPGFFSVKSDTVSHSVKWGAKILALCIQIVIFGLLLSFLLPISVELSRVFLAENISVVHPTGIFEVISAKNISTNLYGSIIGFTYATFVMCVFSMLGILIGEIFRGKTIVISIFLALYYLVPLGNYLDPRNVFAAAGKNIFWFGGTFNPYNADLDLLDSSSAIIIMVLSAILFVTVSGYVRFIRTRNLKFLRKQV